jgi:non-specific serine/threonine protein kinase/serine/threonine-protein kinase
VALLPDETARVSAERWLQVKQITSDALERPESERPAWLTETCAGDELLRREVESLLSAHASAGDFLETPALEAGGAAQAVATATLQGATPAVAGRSIGPYRIIRELGQGGMAVVYLAERADAAFEKQVAIKIVRGGAASSSLTHRFFEERRILATLDHPNIARLLDGGTTEEGVPYVVMECVFGVPLDAYCEERALSLEPRLVLFRQVCTAVQYAHQHLVIHRDLKARNILVAADGTPKLLDFGIAKLLEPGLAPGNETRTGYRALTLEAASPEQVRGEPMTVTSDVYSLGVLLYRLLTGQSPYGPKRRSDVDLTRAICEETPVRPSVAAPVERRRQLRSELDAIVLKALRKEPERRYPSVQDFSEDVRRHLEGRPVSARKDTLGYRAGRFVHRHPWGVASVALILITLISATAITARQARIAEREHVDAERRFNQVRKLANAVLFDYHDAIAALPGSTAIRERMVKDALQYLDTLSAASSGDATLQRELASAYEKVGDVQGSPSRANLGNFVGALTSHAKALAIRTRLAASSTASPQAKLELARSYAALGELSQVTSDIPAALANYRKAFAVFDSIPAESAGRQRGLGVLEIRFGRALVASGELAQAIESYRKGIALTLALSAADPSDRTLKRDLAIARIAQGDALADTGDLHQALEAERSALALLEPLVTPTDAPSRRDVNTAQGRISDVLAKMGDKRGALAIELKALGVSQELLNADPSNALAARDTYIDYYKTAFLQEALGDIEAAIANQRRCVVLCEAQVKANPASSQLRGDLAVAYFRLGEMLEKRRDRLPEARKSYEKAVTITEALSNADPSNAGARGDLSEDIMKLSDASLKLGDRDGALNGYRRALAIREELVKANPDSAEERTQLARIYESLGAYSLSLATAGNQKDDWREARRWYQLSLETFQGLQQGNKLSADYATKPRQIDQRIRTCDAALLKR